MCFKKSNDYFSSKNINGFLGFAHLLFVYFLGSVAPNVLRFMSFFASLGYSGRNVNVEIGFGKG